MLHVHKANAIYKWVYTKRHDGGRHSTIFKLLLDPNSIVLIALEEWETGEGK